MNGVRMPNKERGLASEMKVAELLEGWGFLVDHRSGAYGVPDLVIIRKNQSFGAEVKSTWLHFKHKQKDILQIGRVTFFTAAVLSEYNYCLGKKLKPIVLILLKIRGEDPLLYYYPFDFVLGRCRSDILCFSLSSVDVFRRGQPADHWFSCHSSNGDSSYCDIQNFVEGGLNDGSY